MVHVGLLAGFQGSFVAHKTLVGKDGRFCYIICTKSLTTQEVPLGRCPGLGERCPLGAAGVAAKKSCRAPETPLGYVPRGIFSQRSRRAVNAGLSSKRPSGYERIMVRTGEHFPAYSENQSFLQSTPDPFFTSALSLLGNKVYHNGIK